MCTKAIALIIGALLASVCAAQPTAEANVDRVFHFTNTDGVQNRQEIGTVVRSIAQIGQVSADPTQSGLAMRGTAGQIALAEWLFGELDRPTGQPGQGGVSHEYRLPGGGDDIVRVFYLANTDTVPRLQELATLVRSLGEMRRLFTYNALRAVAVRGTVDQIALAEWLFQELDKPADPQSLAQRSQYPSPHEYRLGGGGDDVVRVFYLTHAGTVQSFQQIVTEVRSITQIPRAFTYNAPRAVAFRGTAAQIAQADQLIQERDK